MCKLIFAHSNVSEKINCITFLEAKYPRVQTMWIKADYSKTDIYEHLRKELADLDIGILGKKKY